MKKNKNSIELQLRELVKETILQEDSWTQAQRLTPLKTFIKELNDVKFNNLVNAKKSLAELYRTIKTEKETDQLNDLLGKVNRLSANVDFVIKSLEKMPELTSDQFSHIRKTD